MNFSEVIVYSSDAFRSIGTTDFCGLKARVFCAGLAGLLTASKNGAGSIENGVGLEFQIA